MAFNISGNLSVNGIEQYQEQICDDELEILPWDSGKPRLSVYSGSGLLLSAG
jgi:hypothetical protein